MRHMRNSFVMMVPAVALLAVACGGSENHVKTPDERLAEQLALADEQAKEEANYDHTFEEGESDSEQAAKFDDAAAEHELKRATLSARTCPASLPEEEQAKVEKGIAKVTLTFSHEGHVKNSSISSNYADTTVGNCVLRAMSAVIVPDYEGEEKTMEWDVDLTGEVKAEEKKKAEAEPKK